MLGELAIPDEFSKCYQDLYADVEEINDSLYHMSGVMSNIWQRGNTIQVRLCINLRHGMSFEMKERIRAFGM